MNAVRITTDASGFAKLAHIRNELDHMVPRFDCRQHGYIRLSDLLIATGMVEIEETAEQPKAITFRIKEEFQN